MVDESSLAFARSHTLYRASCFTPLLCGVLYCMWPHSDGRLVPLVIPWTTLQSTLSYHGDVTHLGRGVWWPDVLAACCTAIGCAAALSHGGRVIAVGAIALVVSAYLFRRGDRNFVYAHVAWHCTPLALALYTADAAEHGFIHAAVWLVVWGGLAWHMGPAAYSAHHGLHDAHAVAVCVGLWALPRATVALSWAYFVVDACVCALNHDGIYLLHAALALGMITLCATTPILWSGGGYMYLLIESTVPPLHWWWRDRASRVRLSVFAAVFFAVRVLAAPLFLFGHVLPWSCETDREYAAWALAGSMTALQWGWGAVLLQKVLDQRGGCRRLSEESTCVCS